MGAEPNKPPTWIGKVQAVKLRIVHLRRERSWCGGFEEEEGRSRSRRGRVVDGSCSARKCYIVAAPSSVAGTGGGGILLRREDD